VDLKESMRVRGLNQTQLAEMIGVTQPTISGWMSGKVVPSKEMAERLEKVLGVPEQENFRKVQRINSHQAARMMGMSRAKFCELAQMGAWDWCKAVFTPSDKGGRWYYHINLEQMRKKECI